MSVMDPNESPLLLTGSAGVLWLSGEDRLSFLERMSTQRLTNLVAGQGRATAVLTDVGRVVDLLTCHAGAEGAALLTSTVEAAAAVAEHLKRYVLRDRVRVTNANDQVVVLRLVGPNALAVAARATGLVPALDEPGAWAEAGEGAETVWLLRHPQPDAGGLGGCDVVVPAGDAATGMTEGLLEAGAIPGDAEDGAAARVQAGIPAFGAEIDGTTNPLELGLRNVVDFAKGCYIGQEVVARLDTYDKVQRRVLRLAYERIDGEAPQSGEKLRIADPDASVPGGRRPGRLTTVAAQPHDPGRGLAMALVPAAWADANVQLALSRDGDPIPFEHRGLIGG